MDSDCSKNIDRLYRGFAKTNQRKSSISRGKGPWGFGKGSPVFSVSSTQPIKAVPNKGRFYGVFRKTATYSKGYLGVFSELFLKSKNALRGEALFSRRKQGFLVRLFADGLFRMIISPQVI
jgi:hypothetical protein